MCEFHWFSKKFDSARLIENFTDFNFCMKIFCSGTKYTETKINLKRLHRCWLEGDNSRRLSGKHGAGVPGYRGLWKTRGIENVGSRGLWKTRGAGVPGSLENAGCGKRGVPGSLENAGCGKHGVPGSVENAGSHTFSMSRDREYFVYQ